MELEQLNPGHGILDCFLNDSKAYLHELGYGSLFNNAGETVAAGNSVAMDYNLAASSTIPTATSSQMTEIGTIDTKLAPKITEMMEKGEPLFPVRLQIMNDIFRPCLENFEHEDTSDHFLEDLPNLIKQFNDEYKRLGKPEPKDVLEHAAAGYIWNLDRLHITDKIDSGAFGTCYKVVPVAFSNFSAVLKLEVHPMDDIPKYGCRPIYCHSLLNGVRYVANLYGWFVLDVRLDEEEEQGKVTLALLMEECSRSTLDVVVTDFKKVDAIIMVRRISRYMAQLMIALSAAECQRVIHRDLKPQNILFAKDIGCPDGDKRDHDKMEVKVIDFGLARTVHEDSAGTEGPGTGVYRAPELLLSTLGGTTTKVDVYSCGVILYYLLTGKLPVRDANLKLRAKVFENSKLKCFQEVTGGLELITCMKKMLAYNPEDRILASDAMPLFKQIFELCAEETGIGCVLR